MSVLISGANGYLGSSLTNYLSEETDKNIQLLVRKLPEHFHHWENTHSIIETNILDFQNMISSINPGVETIIHLASYNEVDTDKNPEDALMINGIGTRNMLEVAKELEVSKFIYFSTQKVYGKNLEGTFTVQSPLRFQDDYSVTHGVGENYCRMFAETTDIDIDIVRPTNIFGAPVNKEIDRWMLVPATFCKSAVENKEIVIKSSGKQKRDFISLDYFNKSIHELLKSTNGEYTIFNLSSESNISIREVAKIVQSSAEGVLNESIDIRINGDEPKKSNDFIVKNNLSSTPTETEVRQKLLSETNKMMKMLNNNG